MVEMKKPPSEVHQAYLYAGGGSSLFAIRVPAERHPRFWGSPSMAETAREIETAREPYRTYKLQDLDLDAVSRLADYYRKQGHPAAAQRIWDDWRMARGY